MKKILTILNFLFYSFSLNAQEKEQWLKLQTPYYHNIIKRFYSMACVGKTDSSKIEQLKFITRINPLLSRYCEELSKNLPEKQLDSIIDASEICDEGMEFGVIISVCLSKSNTIYFGVDSDTPSKIQYIWLNDGTSLNSIINNVAPREKLFLVGSVNDKDGYVNIRNGPSSTAKVTGTLTNRDYFYYIPNGNSDWWQVARTENLKALTGYVHKSRILKFNDMSRSLKNKVRRDRREH